MKKLVPGWVINLFVIRSPGWTFSVLASFPSPRSEFHFLRSFWHNLYPLLLQHAFSVVRTAGSSHYNYVNPVRRDVVNIGELGDNVTIRFVTDNTGPWFLHWWVLQLGCRHHRTYVPFRSHIDSHLAAWAHPIIFAIFYTDSPQGNGYCFRRKPERHRSGRSTHLWVLQFILRAWSNEFNSRLGCTLSCIQQFPPEFHFVTNTHI